MAISSPGVGSNLDVNTIVAGLMKSEQGPLTLVNKQKSTFQTKISAYGSLQGALSKFQDALGNLSAVSKFNVQKAESADTSVFTATPNGKAVESNYAVKVSQLAASQKIAMAGESSVNNVIGTGKLTISLGSYNAQANTFTPNSDQNAVTIDITSANNTLTGIRDAINAANAGVTASIVNDGQSNRLVINAKNTGSINSIKITVADDDTTNLNASGLSKLAFDPTASAGTGKNMTVLQDAKDAILDIDGVTVTKPGNVITDALEGITLNLLKADPARTVDLAVSRDQAAIEKSVNDFVNAFNDANQVIRDLTKYDAASKTGGALLGDAVTRSVTAQIKQVLTTNVDGNSNLKTLNDIGVSFQRNGQLALDSKTLKLAIQNNQAEIPALFAATGKASDSLIKYVGSSSKTVPGTYDVNVSRLATQGSLTGSASPGLVITKDVNDHLEFKIDGVAYNVDLGAGVYSSVNTLAAELQTRLSEKGATAKVAVNGGNIQLISPIYGAASSAMLTAGNGSINLFGSSPVTEAGLDVQGTINGVAATGSGQQLIGAKSDASEGLIMQITAGSPGGRGTVKYQQGYAYQLDKVMTNLLSADGMLASRTEGINSSITRLTKQQEMLQDRLVQIEKRYRQQFTSLDTLIGSMQQTSSYLTQQIAQFKSNN